MYHQKVVAPFYPSVCLFPFLPWYDRFVLFYLYHGTLSYVAIYYYISAADWSCSFCCFVRFWAQFTLHVFLPFCFFFLFVCCSFPWDYCCFHLSWLSHRHLSFLFNYMLVPCIVPGSSVPICYIPDITLDILINIYT